MSTDLEVQAHTPMRQEWVVSRDAWAFSKALAAADEMVPKAFRDRPEAVFAVLQMGAALGIGPMQALTSINSVEGKPEQSSELMAALIRRAGHRIRLWLDGDRTTAYAQIVRADDPTFEWLEQFSIHDAARAGLCTVGPNGEVRSRSRSGAVLPWEAYTSVMLRWRALSQCARFACPDVLAGISYVTGELGGPIPPEFLEGTAPAPVVAPQPAAPQAPRTSTPTTPTTAPPPQTVQPQPEPLPVWQRPPGVPVPEAAPAASSVSPDALEFEVVDLPADDPDPDQLDLIADVQEDLPLDAWEAGTPEWRVAWAEALETAEGGNDFSAVQGLANDALHADQQDLAQEARDAWTRMTDARDQRLDKQAAAAATADAEYRRRTGAKQSRD